MTWTTGLLSLFMTPDEAETVSGDLIEEYHDSILPSVGKPRADIWLARQVAGFVWRAPLAWGLIMAACMSGRFALDTFAPPADYGLRSFVTTWAAILIYLTAAAWSAHRTGRVSSGVLVAAAAHAVGWGLNGVVTIAIFIAAIRSQPEMVREFETTGGWGEIWFLPLMMLPVVLALGWTGGAFGRLLARRTRV
jgi:hypothetical protein